MKAITKGVLFAASALVFLVYLFFFFQEGISFGDSFLKKSVNGKETVFTGRYQKAEVSITVQKPHRDTRVIQFSSGTIQHDYRIGAVGELDGTARDIAMIEDGYTMFEGKYLQGEFGDIAPLYLSDNDVSMTEFVDIQENSNVLTGLSPTKLFLLFIEKYRFRGDFIWFFSALFILLLWGIDLRFPRFFFLFRHALSVDKPEPSEFYLTMQTINRFVFPALAVILFVIAIV